MLSGTMPLMGWPAATRWRISVLLMSNNGVLISDTLGGSCFASISEPLRG